MATLEELKLQRLQHLKNLQNRAAGLNKGVEQYLHDPVAFARDCIDWGSDGGLTFYQEEILALLEDRRRVSVRGPHGLGKSTIAAVTVLWFAVTRDGAGVDWKTVTTAGAWRQLINYLWPEIRKWAMRLKWDKIRDHPFTGAEMLNLSLRLKHGNAFAAAASNPALIEGAHADSLLFVYDESKAIMAGTFDACEGAFSGTGESYVMALSTPGPPQGRFYDVQSRKPGYEDWATKHVTLAEAMRANRISDAWAEQRKLQWGEQSALYQNRVLGEFYAGEEDSVVPLSWVEAANERWHEWHLAGKPDAGAPHIVGVDVARSGTDKTCLAVRQGHVITEIRSYTHNDTMVTTGRVQGLLESDPSMTAIVDVVGVGGGVVDRLREMGAKVQPFTASARSRNRDRTGELGFINCLTGDARVTPIGDLLRVYRGRYEDTLYRVKLTGGDEFTATRNHQVLTSDGWVSVESLHVGSYLLNAHPGERVAISTGPQVDDVIPTLSDVYDAAARLFGPERVDASLVDFHGDRPTGEVDVVTIHRDLLLKLEEAGEHREDVSLIRLLHASGDLTSLSGPNKVTAAGFGETLTDHDVLPLAGELASPSSSLSLSEVLSDQCVGLSVRSLHDTSVAENSADDGVRDAVDSSDAPQGLTSLIASDDVIDVTPHGSLHCSMGPGVSVLHALFDEDLGYGSLVGPARLRERVQGLTGDVTVDEVVSVEKLASSGHGSPYVYTLETETGAYSTVNVVHKNCRAAAWWNLRELLDPSAGSIVALPPDDELLGDLTAPKAGEPQSGGKIKIESKDEIKKRIGRSTDRADAVVQAFWTEMGNWHDAYGTVECGGCQRAFLLKINNVERDKCPHCQTPIIFDDYDDEEAAE